MNCPTTNGVTPNLKVDKVLVLRQVTNDGYKRLDRSSLDDVLAVGASCACDLYTVNFGVTQHSS